MRVNDELAHRMAATAVVVADRRGRRTARHTAQRISQRLAQRANAVRTLIFICSHTCSCFCLAPDRPIPICRRPMSTNECASASASAAPASAAAVAAPSASAPAHAAAPVCNCACVAAWCPCGAACASCFPGVAAADAAAASPAAGVTGSGLDGMWEEQLFRRQVGWHGVSTDARVCSKCSSCGCGSCAPLRPAFVVSPRLLPLLSSRSAFRQYAGLPVVAQLRHLSPLVARALPLYAVYFFFRVRGYVLHQAGGKLGADYVAYPTGGPENWHAQSESTHTNSAFPFCRWHTGREDDALIAILTSTPTVRSVGCHDGAQICHLRRSGRVCVAGRRRLDSAPQCRGRQCAVR